MRIIDAKTWFPELNKGDNSLVYGVNRPIAEKGSYALKYLEPLVNNILEQQDINASDIDLIVSLSMSADHLVEETEIMGPRIGHPLQKAIGAHNAYVFDLMDSSLSKLLFIINTLALAEQYKNILIIRSEIGLSTKADANSGFCLPDGVMAMLVETSSQQLFESQKLPGSWWPLSLELETNIMSTDAAKAQISFPVQDGLIEAIDSQNDKLLSNPCFAQYPHALESWFSPFKGETISYGPFDIIRQIEKKLIAKTTENFVAVSFDPFEPAVEAVLIEFGRGSCDE